MKDDLKKSRVEESKVENTDKQAVEGEKKPVSKSAETKTEVEEEGTEGNSAATEFIIGKNWSAWMHEKQQSKLLSTLSSYPWI